MLALLLKLDGWKPPELKPEMAPVAQIKVLMSSLAMAMLCVTICTTADILLPWRGSKLNRVYTHMVTCTIAVVELGLLYLAMN